MNAAPKMSRAVISRKRFSLLRERDGCKSSAPVDSQSTLATSPQTTAETRNWGKIIVLEKTTWLVIE